MLKNFFAILSSPKGRETNSREYEILPPKLGDFYFRHNRGNVALFVFNNLVSKFIHLINTKPNYQNRGRLDLAPERDLQYSESEIKAILEIYFNRNDADCSVLFLSGHGTPKGDILLWSKDGEISFSFETVRELWDKRTSKQRNRELLIIVDSCYSGNWVSSNQQPDIFVQASCANKERTRDIKVNDTIVGSVFLHNFLMCHRVTDCFYEGVNQTPTCTYLKGDQSDRVRQVFELEIMKRNWDDFKFGFKDKVKSFNRDVIIWEGPIIDGSVELVKEENLKRSSHMGSSQQMGMKIGGGAMGGPPMTGPPMGSSIGVSMGGQFGGSIGAHMGPMGAQFGGNMDIGRTTVTSTNYSSGPEGMIKEESLKRSFQGGNSTQYSSGGSTMFKFGMN